jgi:NAD(P)-dependent dehydrogenase (short-subunit alcohol dehydrogenase family)
MSSSAQSSDAQATANGRLHNHVAAVTGAAGGIGRAFAVRLAAEGAAVAVIDRADGSETVADIAQLGGTGAAFTVDLTDPDDIAAVVAPIADRLGPVDILVNNAGIYPQMALEDVELAELRRVFAINVEAVLLTVQAFAPGMKEAGWGRIVNVSSNSIGMHVPDMAHYLASKMAVIGLTRGIATDLGPFGITANAIAPSAVRTPGTALIDEGGFAAIAQMQTVKRTMVPEDLAGALAFLASEDAAFVTGQTLFVDGGLVRT